jgi:hypothetical protein
MLQALAEALDESLELLQGFTRHDPVGIGLDDPPSTLLEQCVRIVADRHAAPQEPIRTIHHFACSGGTLISKCLAAMPNTQVLSEVDPLSEIEVPTPRFAPTDLLQLVRQSTRGADHGLLIDLFQRNLQAVYDTTRRIGQRLILRDHAHSHFCTGRAVAQRPTLRSIVSDRFPVLSALTVRDPLESYTSLAANQWLHFSPATFEEYCQRYIAFLQAYKGVPIIRYEEFTRAPNTTMGLMCEHLQIPFSEQFGDLFGVFTLTGDSGRTGEVIAPRQRREMDNSLASQSSASPSYRLLRDLLGYS